MRTAICCAAICGISGDMIPTGRVKPGVVFYPYAAVTTENTEIVNSETGESLRTVPKGAVMAVSAMQEDLSVTLPYDRITGASARRASWSWKWCTRERGADGRPDRRVLDVLRPGADHADADWPAAQHHAGAWSGSTT